jgi:hypothetical protein
MGSRSFLRVQRRRCGPFCLRLDVERWTGAGRSCLTKQLRTNTTTLEELPIATTPTVSTYVDGDDDDGYWVRATRPGMSYCYIPWMELLETYNFPSAASRETYTLGTAGTPPIMAVVDRITACLHRNGRIRQGLGQLGGYQVSQAGLLSRVLDWVGGLPTLVYRFLRQGDLRTIGRLLTAARQSAAGCGRKKKRSRESKDDTLHLGGRYEP